MQTLRTDFLVVGTGLAGLAFALKAAEFGRVTLLSKENASSANTPWAQGGIAAVMDKGDSFDSHISDTLRAGAGLCRQEAVENIVKQAPERIADLMSWGVQFDLKSDGKSIDLTREGGHSARRILHFEDHTGSEIHRVLLNRCLHHPNIVVQEEKFAIDLILNKEVEAWTLGENRVIGAYVLDKPSSQVSAILAKAVILATGGAGKVYLYTSNWSGATGDGIAMAFRAGARVSNLEFMQFHPTALYHRDSRNFLISESLRGEGGELINSRGEAFMKKYHELGSLAPRDIVARSIDAEMKKSADACVFLDMRKHDRAYLSQRFPVIYQKCLEFGIDMATQPIPVVPAAHYLCGGVTASVDGATDLPGLWALGETACTGLHGANRLASNSLLECLAMAHNCAQTLQAQLKELRLTTEAPKDWNYPKNKDADEMVVIHHMWDEIRQLMWNYVGIVRSNKRLERASNRLDNILAEVKEYYSGMPLHSDILELRNIAIVAKITVESAIRRKESRGIHYNLDQPWADLDSNGEDSHIWRGRSQY